MSKKKFSLVLFVLALVLVLSGTSVFAAGAEEASPTAPTACTGPIHTGFAVQSHPYDVTRTAAGYAPRTDAHIYVGSTGGAGNDFRALMPFPPATNPPNPGGMPAGSCVLHAELRVFVDAISGEPRPVVAGQIDWATGSVIMPTAPQVMTLGWNVFDVAPQVQAWADGTYPNRGLGLREEAPGGPFKNDVRSRNHANPGTHPTLVIDYQEP
ncbi:MAG: hypothetical protein H6650_21785 [Ardenticatenales bacterium]|nr:hypothetical protein [Ardenticatenales bacterium]